MRVGSVSLKNPVMTASGTAGYGTELAASFDLAALGAVVVKSLAAFEWGGNPPPRLHPTAAGMLNSVGLQGPGLPYWLEHVLPGLLRTGATVVASIWGRSIEEYRRGRRAARRRSRRRRRSRDQPVVPESARLGELFAHDPQLTADVVAAVAGAAGRPVWAKLSPNTDRVVEVASAARDGGAEAVTCVNTLLGLAYDRATRSPALGAGGGGLSGPAIHPVAVRVVHDVAAALPGYPVDRCRRHRHRLGRRGVPARRRRGGAGRDGDVPRPAGAAARARRAQCPRRWRLSRRNGTSSTRAMTR